MKTPSSSKKLLLAAILTTGLGLAISQSALAQPGYNSQARQNPCGIQAPCGKLGGQIDPVTQKAREKFLNETTEIRKNLTVKRAEMRAIMAADIPDATRASQVAGELFDLREQLRAKALDYGLPLPAVMSGQMSGAGGFSGKQNSNRQGRGNRW